jgi:hypothetical protein
VSDGKDVFYLNDVHPDDIRPRNNGNEADLAAEKLSVQQRQARELAKFRTQASWRRATAYTLFMAESMAGAGAESLENPKSEGYIASWLAAEKRFFALDDAERQQVTHHISGQIFSRLSRDFFACPEFLPAFFIAAARD